MSDIPAVGVVKAPGVADALATIGFRTVTGVDFRQAATAVSRELDDGAGLPVVVLADGREPGLGPWTRVTAGKTRVVALTVDSAPSGGTVDVPLPCTVNDILTALGYQTTDLPAGAVRVDGHDPHPAPDATPLPLPLPHTARTPPPAGPTPEPPSGRLTAADLEALLGGPSAAATPSATPAAPTPPRVPVRVLPERRHVQQPAVESAPTRAARTAPAPAAPSEDADLYGMFEEDAARTDPAPHAVRTHTRRADVIIVASGKGGVGKTTTSLMLAQEATQAGLHVVLIDGNRGQADTRKYLRVGSTPLPTVHDAAASGPAAAVLPASVVNPIRQAAHVPDIGFAVVLGPDPEHAAPADTPASLYADVMDYAADQADLVVVDTQILEAAHTDLWDQVLIPAVRSGAWLVGVMENSPTAVTNLRDRLAELTRADVDTARTLILGTRYDGLDDTRTAHLQHAFTGLGTFVGVTGTDPQFHAQLNLGRLMADAPAVAPATRTVLRRVTGRDDLFTPDPSGPPARPVGTPAAGRPGGVLARLFGKRARS